MVTPWWQIVIGFLLLAGFLGACWLMVWDVAEHAEEMAAVEVLDELWDDGEEPGRRAA